MGAEGDDEPKGSASSVDSLLRDIARAEPQAPPSGETLVGKELAHFRIEAMLGAGGMGIVYRATDLKLRRAEGRSAAPRGGFANCTRHREGAGACARQERRASRPEARQRDDRRGRRGQDPRLRVGEGPRERGDQPERNRASGHRVSRDRGWADPRNTRVHVARASGGQTGRRAQRSVCAGEREQQDQAETAARLEALAKKWPLDVEIYMWLGLLHHDEPAALGPSSRALELDPDDGQSWENRASALVILGRFAEARQAYEKCLAISTNGADCSFFLAMVDNLEGRCADFERGIHRSADASAPYRLVVPWAMYSVERPELAVREAITRSLADAPLVDRALMSATFDTELAVLAGDFDQARGLAAKEAAALAAHPTARAEYLKHYILALQIVPTLLELGDTSAARVAAQDFLGRSTAWTREQVLAHGVDRSPYLARVARGVGD